MSDRRTSTSVAVVIALVALALGVVMIVKPSSGDSAQRARSGILIAQGDDRLPNTTASDWITYADLVVVATPVDEEEVGPSATEIERGEGLIFRNVRLRVDDVIWQRPQFKRAVPEEFDWLAYGWQFKGDPSDDRVEMAGKDQPRIETGHTYVMALVWEPERCSEGDHVPARWTGLGEDSIIPFDGGVLGQGELEGRGRTLAAAKSAAADVPAEFRTLEDKVTGSNVASLAKALHEGKVQARGHFPALDRSATSPCS